jgi:hypothetical protein
MTRAGKEPAEDVKRAVRRAIEFAGLQAGGVRMVKSARDGGRWVHGQARPDGWGHDCPPMSVLVLIKFDGEVERARVLCSATKDDPAMAVFDTPNVQHCWCDLADLPRVLKEVWAARGEVLRRVESGEPPPFWEGGWPWDVPGMRAE